MRSKTLDLLQNMLTFKLYPRPDLLKIFDQIVDLNMGYDPKHRKISIISKLYGRKYPKSLQVEKILSVAFKRNSEE